MRKKENAIKLISFGEKGRESTVEFLQNDEEIGEKFVERGMYIYCEYREIETYWNLFLTPYFTYAQRRTFACFGDM